MRVPLAVGTYMILRENSSRSPRFSEQINAHRTIVCVPCLNPPAEINPCWLMSMPLVDEAVTKNVVVGQNFNQLQYLASELSCPSHFLRKKGRRKMNPGKLNLAGRYFTNLWRPHQTVGSRHLKRLPRQGSLEITSKLHTARQRPEEKVAVPNSSALILRALP